MELTLQVHDGIHCIIQNLPVPAALCQCVRDASGKIIDYIFIVGNGGFEERMAQGFSNYRGKKVTELFPYLKSDPFERVDFVAKTMAAGVEQDQTFFYSRFWKRWVHMVVYPLKDNRFLALYPDTAETNGIVDKLTRIIASLEDILGGDGHGPDYETMVRVLHDITASKVALLNLIHGDENTSETVAIAAEADILTAAEQVLGKPIIGSEWSTHIPVQMQEGDQIIRCYSHLSECTERAELKEILEKIEAEIGLGDTVVARINLGDRTIGYFIFCMPWGIPFHQEAVVSIYSRYAAMLIEAKQQADLVAQKAELFESLFENMGSGANVFQVVKEGRTAEDYIIQASNKKSLEYNGRSWEEASGCSLADLNPRLDNQNFVEFLRNVWLTGKPDYRINRVDRPNGETKWYESRAFRLPDGNVSTLYNDITDRVRAQLELTESEEKLNQLVDNMSQGLAVMAMEYDDQGNAVDCRYERVNPSFERMTGLREKDIIGRTVYEVLPNFDEDWIQIYNRVVSEGKPLQFEEYFSRFGAYYHVVVYRPYPGAFATILTDISKRKKAEEELLYRSRHDHLTGLYNRHYFDEAVRALDHPEGYPLTLILADLDDLKMINDVYGHQEGDRTITTVAGILQQLCPDDAVLARTGGDEFTILLPARDEGEVQSLIQRIEQTLETQQSPNEVVSMAIGYAAKHSQNVSFGDVYKQAEDMMYKNKLLWRSRSSIGTVDMIMQALREKNPREAEHADQVAIISQEIGKAMRLSWDSLRETVTAAMMHDIGKIGVPDQVLDKPGALTESEYQTVQRHCESGYKILRPISQLHTIAETVLAHHERWDGKGYPRGKSGEQIPLHARIIAVADTVAAMISERPYRPASSLDQAAAEVRRCAGTQFDPQVANAFLKRVAVIREKLASHLQD